MNPCGLWKKQCVKSAEPLPKLKAAAAHDLPPAQVVKKAAGAFALAFAIASVEVSAEAAHRKDERNAVLRGKLRCMMQGLHVQNAMKNPAAQKEAVRAASQVKERAGLLPGSEEAKVPVAREVLQAEKASRAAVAMEVAAAFAIAVVAALAMVVAGENAAVNASQEGQNA